MGATEAETPQAASVSEELREHYRMVALALVDGEVVPFLGAGVNLCGRPSGTHFKPGEFLPSGAELAQYLARRCGYPLPDADNLVRVTQYQVTMQDEGPLYKRLREVFDADYPPTELHAFLARLPTTLGQKFGTTRNQLIVTTNYDDALERAFREAGQPFDLFTYLAFGEDAGKFVHTSPDGKRQVVGNPKKFSEPLLEQRPVILKIHGAVDRLDSRRDSYVITEDHYIDFLQRTEISKLVPVSLLPAMQASHFLFLGYSLRDWNLRVILQRIWDEQDHGWSSWAVQHKTSPLDQRFWMKRSVDIQVVDLQDYVRGLNDALSKIAAESEDAA
jgi:SIR2-like domain